MQPIENGAKKPFWIREKQLLANSSPTDRINQVWDVNVLAIFLSKGHPGFEYVSPVIESGLRGAYVPVLMDILPLRAFWVMTHPWGLPKAACSSAIQHFIQAYDIPRYVALSRETLLEGFRLQKN